MKNIFLFCFFSFAVIGCIDKTVLMNPEDIRIISAKGKTPSGDFQQFDFQYDQQGRLIDYLISWNGQLPKANTVISYSGITMNFKSEVIPGGAASLVYTLDQSGKPLMRVQTKTMSYTYPNNPQRDYMTDTTYYEYDASGLLKKAWGVKWDSSWYDPGTDNYFSNYATYVEDYINVSGNVTEVNRSVNNKSHTKQGSSSLPSTSTREEKSSFKYDKKYPNKTDFRNAIAFYEFQVFTSPPYILNKYYANFPNQVTRSYVEKNESGQVTLSENNTENIDLLYNNFGFISNVNRNPLQPYVTTITYNR